MYNARSGNSLSRSHTPLSLFLLLLLFFLDHHCASLVFLLPFTALRASQNAFVPLCLCALHLICCVPAQRAPRVRLLSHVGGMHSAWKVASLSVCIASKNGNDILFIFCFELVRDWQLKRLTEFNIRPTNWGQSVWKAVYCKVSRKMWYQTTFPGV